jgi:hypothetical protein
VIHAGKGALAALLGFSLLAGPASARCARESDQAAFDITALKTELMVMGVSSECRKEAEYNAFITRFRTQLVEADRAVVGWYRTHYGAGRPGLAKLDAFVTELANLRARGAQRIGGDHCERNGAFFIEVMGLPQGSDLAAYAAGKNLMPSEVPACEMPPRNTTQARSPRR